MNKKNQSITRHIVIGVDANYLHKAIIFYKSLSKVHKNFILHLFCYDDVIYKVFKKLNFKNIVLYHTSEFETEEILKIKSSKERLYEYYWAIGPYITRKVLLEQKTESVALADCDIMFFQSPEVIFEELGKSDVIIQPNNFSYQFENDFVPYGYYCTSFQCFKKNKNGKKILDYWHKLCMEWCSHIREEGKFGEQKYLDDWRIRFKKVREIANVGTNVAPWNIQKYDITINKKEIMINNKWPLVYYHYHSFKMNLSNYKYIITGDRNLKYPISKDAVEYIYKPYIKLMKQTIKNLKKIKEYRMYVKDNPNGNYHIQKINI
jgi:hypothetical protein